LSNTGIIGEKLVEGLEIDDGLAVEADLVGGVDQEPHRVLVVQNHLRLEVRAALGVFAQLDETLWCID
jgi:hypothetical protein